MSLFASLKRMREFLAVFTTIFMSQIGTANSFEVPPFSNGAVAYAYPISSIIADGNSEDWPTDLTKYPIAITPYSTPSTQEDFQAFFQVGYNTEDQALYFLISVQDEDHFVDSSDDRDWNTQDTYNLYVDRKHSSKGSGVNLFQFASNLKETADVSTSWDPEAAGFSWDQVTIATTREGTATLYEVRVFLGEDLKIGKPIGIDHVLIDRDSEDEDTGQFIAWGMDGGKSQSPVRLGDVIPLDPKTTTGKVVGKVKWKDTSITEMTNRIKLTSNENPDLWTIAQVDSLGNYATTLPEGDFKIAPFWHQRNEHRIDLVNSGTEITVIPGKSTNAKDLELLTRKSLDLIPEKGILANFNPKDPSQLDNFITQYQEYYVIPGVSLALIKEGKVIYHKTYGVKNAYTRENVKEETLFEAASVTKPVFAFAVCRLVERGILDLDKPLYTYLPFEDIAHDERYKLITARHVLSHKTGFPNWAWMNEDGKIDIKFTPGTDYGYSGEGFEYLKRVVVEITGKDIQTILEEEVLQPLELENTYFSKNDHLQRVVSNGHFGPYPTRAQLPNAAGMAWSMHTEAKSFTQFALGLLNKKGMKAATYTKMFTKETLIPREDEEVREGWEDYFGLGIHMEETPFGPTFGHGGNNGDFKCEFKMYPELGAGFVVFTNSNSGDYLHNALNELLFTGKQAVTP